MLQQANPNAAAAGGEAIAKVGQHIQQVAEIGQGVFHRVRTVKEAGIRSSFMADLDQKRNAFSLSLMKRQDPSAWPEEFKNLSNEWREQAKSVGLSPDGQAKLEYELNNWVSKSSIHLETIAANRDIEEGRARILGSYNYSASRNDYDGMTRSLAEAQESGVFPAHEIDEMKHSGQQIAGRATMEDLVMQNPKQALEAFNDPTFLNAMPGVTEADRQRGIASSEKRLQEMRTMDIDDAQTSLKEGKLTDADVDKFQYLSENDKRDLKVSIRKADPPKAEQHSQAWELLYGLKEKANDPGISDQQYGELWNTTRSKVYSMMPPSYRGDINQELNAGSPSNRSRKRESPSANPDLTEIRTMTYQQIDRALKAGAFGDSESTDENVRENAHRKANAYKMQMRQTIAQTPGITLTDAQQKADELMHGDKSTSAATNLQSVIPGSGMIDIDMLPPKTGVAPSTTRVAPSPAPEPGTVQVAPDEPSLLPKKGDILKNDLKKFLTQ